jgi:outer membrane protein assembly factor BamB
MGPEQGAHTRGPNALAVIRLVLAWVLTLAVLPYAWTSSLLLQWSWIRPTEVAGLILLLAGLAAVIALNRGLAAEFPRPGFGLILGLAIGVPWVIISGLLVGLSVGPLLPRLAALLLFVPASFWLAWAAWMFFAPLPPRTRWGILVLLAILPAVPRGLLRTEGTTGAGEANFVWRWHAAGKGLGDEEPDVIGAGTADLAHTTPNDYPRFRGSDGLGTVPKVRLARDWQREPPRLVWRRPVGDGLGAFAVVGDYAVTQEQRGSKECVVCYRVADGALMWLHADPARFPSGNPGPRTTPAIAGGRVFTVGATGLLNCLDGADGRVIWSVNILEDNQAANINHGVCASPLVIADRVLVCPTGANGPSLAAYDGATGQRLWQAGRDQASYSSPLLTRLAGVPQVLLYTAQGVTAHDAATGHVLWSFPWTNDQRQNCVEPIPHAGKDDQVFVSTGWGKGCTLLRVEHPAAGNWSVHPLWQNRHMRTRFSSAVAQRGFVYGLDEGTGGILECLDLATGRLRWKDGRYGHGQLLLAGDLLLVQAENGEVVLVEPSPDGLHELGRLAVLDDKTWNHLALAGRYLLVRNSREAACYALPLETDE